MATVLENCISSESTEASVYRSAQPVVSFDEAEGLAEQFGSPLLVASRTALLRNYKAMRQALPGVEFFYAAKANRVSVRRSKPEGDEAVAVIEIVSPGNKSGTRALQDFVEKCGRLRIFAVLVRRQIELHRQKIVRIETRGDRLKPEKTLDQ